MGRALADCGPTLIVTRQAVTFRGDTRHGVAQDCDAMSPAAPCACKGLPFCLSLTGSDAVGFLKCTGVHAIIEYIEACTAPVLEARR